MIAPVGINAMTKFYLFTIENILYICHRLDYGEDVIDNIHHSVLIQCVNNWLKLCDNVCLLYMY